MRRVSEENLNFWKSCKVILSILCLSDWELNPLLRELYRRYQSGIYNKRGEPDFENMIPQEEEDIGKQKKITWNAGIFRFLLDYISNPQKIFRSLGGVEDVMPGHCIF